MDDAGDNDAEPVPFKVRILDEVKEIVGKRGLNYGTPEDNFERIARRWTVHLKNRYGIDILIDDIDVAAMCVDLKLARIENEPCHMDSWKDICGYGACGGEIAQHRIDRTWADARTIEGVSGDMGEKIKTLEDTLCGDMGQVLYPKGGQEATARLGAKIDALYDGPEQDEIQVGDRVGAHNCFGIWREGTVVKKEDHWLLVDIGGPGFFLTTVNAAELLPEMSKSEKCADPTQGKAASW